MLTAATFGFIEEIERQDDLSGLVSSFQDLIGKFGLVYYMVGDPRPPAPINDYLWATTWPQEWLDRWRSQNYVRVDPILRDLRLHNKPLRWNPTQYTGDRSGKRILEEAGEFRMNAGFAIPVHSPAGTVVVSLGTEHYELGKSEELCLHLASIYFHAKLGRLRTPGAPPQRVPRLAPRERECLSWVAAGKTDWEISQILNIAEQTVHEYVQNALTKLNATTRAQAVAIAIFTKQINV